MQVIDVAQSIRKETFLAVLRPSPVPAAEAVVVYDYCLQRRVDSAFLLAMFKHESQYGTQGTATQTHSWGNTRLPVHGNVKPIGTAQGRRGTFPIFKNWADGGISTVARFVEYGPYQGKRTVEEIVPIWAPVTDGNDPGRYVQAVLAEMERIKAMERPGSGTVARPPMRQVPAANRGGYNTPIQRLGICWHITGGTNSLGWLTGTASDVSANYLIARDGVIYELVPWTEAAWANGIPQEPDLSNPFIAATIRDGANPNTRFTGIECEGPGTCGNPGALTAPQRDSLIALTAWLCQEQGHPADRSRIIRHSQIMKRDRKCCPGYDEATEMVPWIQRAATMLGSAPSFSAAWRGRAGTGLTALWRAARGR